MKLLHLENHQSVFLTLLVVGLFLVSYLHFLAQMQEIPLLGDWSVRLSSSVNAVFSGTFTLVLEEFKYSQRV